MSCNKALFCSMRARGRNVVFCSTTDAFQCDAKTPTHRNHERTRERPALEGSDLNSSAFSLQATTPGQARLCKPVMAELTAFLLRNWAASRLSGSQEQYANLNTPNALDASFRSSNGFKPRNLGRCNISCYIDQ
jgi:hypothetical protein